MTTIIIGLGNPGKKFEDTRHNVGFMVLDKFAKENNFSEFELQKKYESLISEGTITEEKTEGHEEPKRRRVILAKPQTFMNESGKAVSVLTKPYTLSPKPLIIIVHDDIDLPVGKIKIVKDRGSAGHKGVESIIKNIGNDGLIRLRIGIKPASAKAPAGDTKKIVLKKFAKEENIAEAIKKSVEALNFFIEQGLEKTMNAYN